MTVGCEEERVLEGNVESNEDHREGTREMRDYEGYGGIMIASQNACIDLHQLKLIPQ